MKSNVRGKDDLVNLLREIEHPTKTIPLRDIIDELERVMRDSQRQNRILLM